VAPVRVYVDMVGDLFHLGHVNLLRAARSLGTELVVGVNSDEDVLSYKRMPVLTLEERAAVIGACRYVDEVIAPCPLQVDEAFLREHRIGLVVHGDDFNEEMTDYFYRVPREMGIFRTVPYTRGISTSEILRRLLVRFEGELRDRPD
jgi:cytidyltransferase-like protein